MSVYLYGLLVPKSAVLALSVSVPEINRFIAKPELNTATADTDNLTHTVLLNKEIKHIYPGNDSTENKTRKRKSSSLLATQE